MSLKSLDPSSAAPPRAEEVRAELETILAAPAFRRSERHSRFLRYVCEAALRGNGGALNEVLIAHEVFDRGADYSPGEDAVVRRQAHSLRQKLQDYYSGEGANDSVRIELPVGRYVPVFIKKSANAPQPDIEAPPGPVPETSPAEPVAPVNAPKLQTSRAVLAIVLILVGLTTGWLLAQAMHRPTRPAIDEALAEIWQRWLGDPAGAFVCFSNPLTAVVKVFPSELPPNALPRRIRVTPEQDTQFRQALGIPPGGFVYLSPAISQAKMGEAIGVVPLVDLFARSGTRVQATQSRFLSWEDFRNQNLILLGHDEANRWLDPILKELPFRLAVTEGDRPRRIVNSSPGKGEPLEYRIRIFGERDQPSEDYALISMIAGIDNQHRLLLLNGLNTEGTQSALEYLTNPATARELVAALHRASPSGERPWKFQAVLHIQVRDKVPTRADLVALRVLP